MIMINDDVRLERMNAYYELKGRLLEEIVLNKQKKLTLNDY